MSHAESGRFETKIRQPDDRSRRHGIRRSSTDRAALRRCACGQSGTRPVCSREAALLEATRREPLYWQERNGESILVDRYKRDLAQVRADAALACELADALGKLHDLVVTRLEFGREVGPTLPRRLLSSATSIDKLVDRDYRIAAAIEAAEAEEAEKRTESEARAAEAEEPHKAAGRPE